ncbi:hypothetical protein PYCC9005_001794 [Savitreella phatthalungensis]
MPAPVLHLPAHDVGKAETGQSEGMTRKAALVNVSDKLCSSIMLAEPHSSSAIHTHGELDTIIYAVKGIGKVKFADGSKEVTLKPGDFALIPAHAEHQEINEGDEELEWVIVRSGRTPIVNNLDGWSSETRK